MWARTPKRAVTASARRRPVAASAATVIRTIPVARARFSRRETVDRETLSVEAMESIVSSWR
jgi:hypothetical protein